MKKKFMTMVLVSCIGLFGIAHQSLADSPATSTPFYKAYEEIPIVQEAHETGNLTIAYANYINQPNTPIDVKAAMINAIGWKFEGKDNADRFRAYLGLKYNILPPNLTLSMLKDDEVFCLGYFTLLDDYFHPEKAIPILEEAAKRLPQSYTVAMVLNLAEGQEAMETSFSRVWDLTEEVLTDDGLKKDMRIEANEIILDYLKLYQDNN